MKRQIVILLNKYKMRMTDSQLQYRYYFLIILYNILIIQGIHIVLHMNRESMPRIIRSNVPVLYIFNYNILREIDASTICFHLATKLLSYCAKPVYIEAIYIITGDPDKVRYPTVYGYRQLSLSRIRLCLDLWLLVTDNMY